MSALPAQTRPPRARAAQPRPDRRTTSAAAEPRLRPAPDRALGRAKPRLVYAIVAVGSIGVIAIAQLLLSIAMTQGAYELDGYQIRQAQLARDEAKLSEDLDGVESPQFLAANAEALGMVPNSDPVYLRLSDGAVLGVPTAADGGAVASGPLVPNSLIDGVPLVTEQQAAQTPSGGQGAGIGAAPAAEPAATTPPAPAEGLPTPATH
ncbi:hypothetical protein EDM22_12905 [Agromyces tardus]|jgi:hypothetical protein|uniref:Cell division protein FtsL n=1 Tax=Agromyces tardus TaxID=2583849 RepID=A0A3M8A7B0_9MICO|nr:hypothetical protein [Agromyces tardus]RNB47036.1 hypothetical protein EDM22_12905 [Agromyces tardus]